MCVRVEAVLVHNWRSIMTRLPVLAIAALTLVASPSLLLATTTPAAAQDDDWSGGESDSSLRDLVRSWIQERGDRRDMLLDLIQERRDRRDEVMDLLNERMDRRDELREFLRYHPRLREHLRERLASRWDDEDEGDGDWRGRLRDRLAERRGGDCYFLTRSLRNEDRSLLVVVRRRICRD
jgi:hypothetical protein